MVRVISRKFSVYTIVIFIIFIFTLILISLYSGMNRCSGVLTYDHMMTDCEEKPTEITRAKEDTPFWNKALHFNVDDYGI